MPVRLSLSVLLLVNLVLSPSAADEPKEPREDRPGDVLPPRAVARIRTASLLTDEMKGRRVGKTVEEDEWLVATRFHAGTLRCRFLDDGATVLLQTELGRLAAHDLTTGRELRRFTFPAGVEVLDVSGDGKQAATRSESSVSVRLIELATGKTIRTLDQPPEGLGYPTARTCRLFPDGRMLTVWEHNTLSGSWDTFTTLTDLVSGKELRSATVKPKTFEKGLAILSGGRRVALVDDFATLQDPEVLVWDAESGKRQQFTIPGKRTCLRGEFTPDDRFLHTWDRYFRPVPLLSLTPTGEINLWELATGRLAHTIKLPGRLPTAVGFRRDGRLVALGMSDGDVALWDVVAGTVRRYLKGHRGPVQSLTFSADGKRLISVGSDLTDIIWDVADLLAPPRPSGPALTADRLDALWADLAAEDAARAYRAVLALAAAPEQAVPVIRKKLVPVAPVPAERLQQLLADLDSPRFTVRRRARRDLAEIGGAVVPALKKGLEGGVTLETRRRIEELLSEIGEAGWPPEGLRQSRALLALEYMGNPAARQHVDRLASGAPLAWLTEQARAALTRLKGPAPKKP